MSHPAIRTHVPRAAVALLWAALASCGGARVEPAPEPPRDEQAAPGGVAAEPFAEVALFILARCPHAAEAVRSVVALKRRLGDALALNVGYIGLLDAEGGLDPSLGEDEIAAARTEICVGVSAGEEEWLSFLECVYGADVWRTVPRGMDACMDRAGIEAGDIADCLESGEGEEVQRRAYGVTNASRIGSSPTILVNGRLYVGPRSEDAILRFICHGSGAPGVAAPEVCAGVPAPEPVAATLLFDSRCAGLEMCDVSAELALLEQLIPGLALTRIDFLTAEGRHLFDLVQKTRAGVRELPFVVLEQGLALGGGGILEEFLIPFGKGSLLAMGSGWDPLAEICDNGADDTGDGAADCADPACADTLKCRKERPRRVELFIMSRCPFAAELMPAADRFLAHFGRERSRVDLSLEFIGTNEGGELGSMHGEEEVAEDLRMVCAEELWGKGYRFMEYVLCRAKDFRSSDYEDCLPKWMDKKKLDACAGGEQGRKLLAASFERARQLGVEGSPTFMLNAVSPMEGRTARAMMEGFCTRNKDPACKKEVAPEPIDTSAKPAPEPPVGAEDTCR